MDCSSADRPRRSVRVGCRLRSWPPRVRQHPRARTSTCPCRRLPPKGPILCMRSSISAARALFMLRKDPPRSSFDSPKEAESLCGISSFDSPKDAVLRASPLRASPEDFGRSSFDSQWRPNDNSSQASSSQQTAASSTGCWTQDRNYRSNNDGSWNRSAAMSAKDYLGYKDLWKSQNRSGRQGSQTRNYDQKANRRWS